MKTKRGCFHHYHESFVNMQYYVVYLDAVSKSVLVRIQTGLITLTPGLRSGDFVLNRDEIICIGMSRVHNGNNYNSYHTTETRHIIDIDIENSLTYFVHVPRDSRRPSNAPT